MLSRLASYLLRGSTSSAEDGDTPLQDDADNACKEVTSIPVETRLRQVEVEGDEWILIDRNGEGFTGLDESWYVTPPACFTQLGPVHVETSPLEDLLIEHPSMSVYRAAGPAPAAVKSESKKQRAAKRCSPVPEDLKAPGPGARLPLTSRNVNFQSPTQRPASAVVGASMPRRPDVPATATNFKPPKSEGGSDNRPGQHHHYHHRHHHHQTGAVAEQPSRRPSVKDLRNVRSDENVRIVQIRSAQKMLEKRSTQPVKRNRLERGNKAREVSSGKARRPRRQDRLRLNNSGANNNRKC